MPTAPKFGGCWHGVDLDQGAGTSTGASASMPRLTASAALTSMSIRAVSCLTPGPRSASTRAWIWAVPSFPVVTAPAVRPLGSDGSTVTLRVVGSEDDQTAGPSVLASLPFLVFG